MAFTNSWDETAPAGTRDVNLGDDDIRTFKLDIRERIAVDHVMTGTDGATTGYHKVVNLDVQSTPTAVASVGQLYTKDVSSKAELHFQDEDGDEIQLTSGGALLVPAGSIVLWDGGACPTGWTLLSTYDDKFLVGNATAGTTGGDDNAPTPAGTNAAEATHTHTATSAAADVGATSSGADGNTLTKKAHTHTLTTSAGASHNHAFTGTADSSGLNRPAFKTIKLCKKD